MNIVKVDLSCLRENLKRWDFGVPKEAEPVARRLVEDCIRSLFQGAKATLWEDGKVRLFLGEEVLVEINMNPLLRGLGDLNFDSEDAQVPAGLRRLLRSLKKATAEVQGHLQYLP